MKKKIEVYFILYIGLLMAFFGIDSEVADYKKRQQKLLEQIALNKIDNLVKVSSSSLSNDGKEIFFKIDLEGSFEQESFEGSLLFNNYNTSEVFSKKLIRDYGSKYYLDVPTSYFKSPDEEYEVQLVFRANPIFDDSTYNLLLNEISDKKLVDEIIKNIKNKGINEKIIDLPNVFTPTAIVDLPAFKIIPKQSVLNIIRGLNGKIDLIVAGVKMKNDYELEIDASTKKKFGINIVKQKTGALITLSNPKKGIIRMKGIRKKDGEDSFTSVSIKIHEPTWKEEPRIDPVYVNDFYEFDGLLKNLDTKEDFTRYKLKVSGLEDTTINGEYKYKSKKLLSEGEIRIQLYIDGNKIDKMYHSIKVVSPPCPKISFDRIDDKNKIEITVRAFGAGNKIKLVQIRKGAMPDISSPIKRYPDGEHGFVYKRIVLLNPGSTGIELYIKTNNNYCNGETTKFKAIF